MTVEVDLPAPWTVFLDRDGVFCRLKLPGVRHERDFEWLPGVREAFARLNRPDVRTCLVTNQPQVGHLLAMPGHVRRVHEHLLAELEEAGGRLDRIEVSYSPVWLPHARRKPRAGMMMAAARAWARAGQPLDRARAVMVGDTVKDARAARTFGIPCILLATTYTREELERRLARSSAQVWAIEDGLPGAVQRILDWMDGLEGPGPVQEQVGPDEGPEEDEWDEEEAAPDEPEVPAADEPHSPT